jgi:hypothetical protein
MIRNGVSDRPRGRDRTMEGRRGLDLAEGILVGLRRYRPEAAFEELVDVALRHDLSVSAVASALVGLATGYIDGAESTPGTAAGSPPDRQPRVGRPPGDGATPGEAAWATLYSRVRPSVKVLAAPARRASTRGYSLRPGPKGYSRDVTRLAACAARPGVQTMS